MLSVNAARYRIFCLTLYFICVSSDEGQFYSDFCETSTLDAPLGSSVLLACTIPQSPASSRDWVQWIHNVDSSLVNFTSREHIQFLDPRHGRVKAFPIKRSLGDYSIRIDELQESDLGFYLCKRGDGDGCHQVKVTEQAVGGMSAEAWLLVYAAAGLAVFIILLSVCSCCWVKHACCWSKSTPDYVNNALSAVVILPPEETSGGTGNEQPRGADNNQLIYENDEYDPDMHQNGLTLYPHNLGEIQPDPDRRQGPARMESQRRKHGFHRELFNRLRQASLSRHYYVNQAEMKQQVMSSQMDNGHRASFWRKKANQNHETYKNPIYNNSTDQLNRL